MKTYRFPSQIGWEEVEDLGVLSSLFHWACTEVQDREGLDLNLFPEKEVLWEIGFRASTRLGDNFAEYIRMVVDRVAKQVVSALESDDRRPPSRKIGWPECVDHNGRLARAYGLEEFVAVRISQVFGSPQEDGKELYVSMLGEDITTRWLKVYMTKSGWGWVRPWLIGLAKDSYSGRKSWEAQKVLGVAYCPVCEEKVEGREPMDYPELCPKCEEQLEEDHVWCAICQTTTGPEYDCMCV